MKPKVFIASSSAHARVLDAIARELEPVAIPYRWVDGRKELGRNILEWAVDTADECDFGVFIFAPDRRWAHQVNGNVLLELGLFLARRGRDRCLIVRSRDARVPRDLDGIITARYDGMAFRKSGAPALAEACDAIRASLRRNRTLADEIQGLWLESKLIAKREGRYSILEFYTSKGDLKLKGRAYNRRGARQMEWPRHVNYCWVPSDLDEVWHTFDAQFGPGGAYTALGVSYFQFDGARLNGEGHFVVSGSGGIEEGLIPLRLERITPELLASYGLPGTELRFDDQDACGRLIRAIARRRGRRRATPPASSPSRRRSPRPGARSRTVSRPDRHRTRRDRNVRGRSG